MEILSPQEALNRASEVCGVPSQVLRVAELSDVRAYFVGEPIRGGVQMIISEDGSLMFAASSLDIRAATELFLAGRRTDVSRFRDLRELNRKKYADLDNLDG